VDKQQPARILIVEDEPTIALTLQDLLVEAGFEVACVTGRLQNALALIEGAGCCLSTGLSCR
jgi:CheY-like chemotaxis protein